MTGCTSDGKGIKSFNANVASQQGNAKNGFFIILAVKEFKKSSLGVWNCVYKRPGAC